VKRLKPLLIPFSKTILFSIICIGLLYQYHFYVYVPIPCIGIIFLYLYRSPVSVPLSYIMILNNDIYCTYCLTCYYCYVDHLTPDMLLLDSCSLLWYHLSPTTCHVNTWPVVITFTGILYLLSCIIYNDLYPEYSCTPVIHVLLYSRIPELVLSCCSYKLIIT